MTAVQRLITTKELSDFTPAIDPRRGPEGIIDGRNFMNGIDGPFSAFASNIAVYRSCDVNTAVNVTSYISPKGIVYYGTPTGVYTLDPITRVWTQIVPVTVAPANKFWPWSFAYVGGLLYMAQNNVGLYQWDETNLALKQIAVYNNAVVIGICEAYGRLIYLTPAVVGYSVLDDGTNQTPSTVTGAGFQPLSLIGGTPYHVGRTSNGFVVATSNGLMLGQYVTAAFVFAFGQVFRTVKIFSPNAACEIPDHGLAYIDQQGVRLFDGSQPVDLDETMSQFMKDKFILTMARAKLGCIRLSYSLATRYLYVQFAPNAIEGQFSNTYVYSTVTKQWGSFDHAHNGVVDYIDVNSLFYAGYMSLEGYLRYFIDQTYVEDIPGSVADFRFTVNADRPPWVSTNLAGASVIIFHTNINLVDPIPGYYYSLTSPLVTTGMYAMNETVLSDTMPSDLDTVPDTSGTPWVFYSTFSLYQSGMVYYYPIGYTSAKLGLASKLEIGPYRYEQQFLGAAAADETSSITALIVGTGGTEGVLLFDDWATYDGLDDWLADPESVEDYALGVTNANNFSLQLRDTDDGITSPFFGDETLSIVENLGASLQYSPAGNSSIFHRLAFQAINPGEFYAIKTIDMSGALTGRRL